MSNFNLKTKSNLFAKILHLTDLHLVENMQDKMFGISTNQSYLTILEQIQQKKNEFDCVVFSGDIAQNATKKTYQFFVDSLKNWNIPCFWIPGNHDNFSLMQTVLSLPLVNKKCIKLNNDWTIILLNSQKINEVGGFLSTNELSFLKNNLKSNDAKIIFIHHHLLPVNSEWIDPQCVENAVEFFNLIQSTNKVKAIFHGHIHQDFCTKINQIDLISTCSTCFQFKEKTTEFTLDNKQPGWREITLFNDGTFEHKLFRLRNGSFDVDNNGSGY